MSLSEIEDDPEPYESSEDEWAQQNVAKGTLGKNIVSSTEKVHKGSTNTRETKSMNGCNKNNKRKCSASSKSLNKKSLKISTPRVISSNTYATGSFVILKKDAQVGDPNKHPWIWKIDGKSLLQKYEPFEHEGKIRHKNTSIYTGWSPLDMDDYAPVTIDLIEQGSGKVIVELHWNELKCIVQDDSD